MSYCRWSSDDWQCDLYVWADVSGGWRSEVAHRRRTWDIPLPPEPSGDGLAWFHRYYDIMRLMRDETNWHWTDLPDPEGGRSYWHDTPGECADNLERLREAGFNVPQYAIDELRAEDSTEG